MPTPFDRALRRLSRAAEAATAAGTARHPEQRRAGLTVAAELAREAAQFLEEAASEHEESEVGG